MQRPRRSDVTPSYDLGVDAYVEYWSPVILPPAQDVVAALDLRSGARVLDVGTGAGAVVGSIRETASGAVVLGLDPSIAMLRAARRDTSAVVVQGDAITLPFRGGAFDAVTLAYVLFHVSDPAAAMAEVHRVLAAGGVVGSVTWMRDGMVVADFEWGEILDEAGAPPLPQRRSDDGLNSPGAIEALYAASGLRVERVWTTELRHRWDRDSYWRRRTGAGVSVQRLSHLAPGLQQAVLDQARARFDELPASAFEWSGEVVCSVARKP